MIEIILIKIKHDKNFGFGKDKIKISKFKLNFITRGQPPITDQLF